MTREVKIILPNTHQLWISGISLSVYSRSYDSYTHEQDFSRLGRLVHDYKYIKNLNSERRIEIIKECSQAIINELQLKPFPAKETFNCLVSVPPNISKDIALPREIAEYLTAGYAWLTDCSKALTMSRTNISMKNTKKEERGEEIRGAYLINTLLLPSDIRGFLIIDDIYDTGSTVREIARTLKRHFPEIPRYVITLTHLRSIWR